MRSIVQNSVAIAAMVCLGIALSAGAMGVSSLLDGGRVTLVRTYPTPDPEPAPPNFPAAATIKPADK